MARSSSESRSEPFRRFEALAKRLLSVPKKAVDEKEKERPIRPRKNSGKPASGD